MSPHYSGIILGICIHLVITAANPDDELYWYTPASTGKPNVEEITTSTNEYILPSIRKEIEEFSEITSGKFSSRIASICGHTPNYLETRQIIEGILTPSDPPSYLDILPRQCSEQITTSIPYMLDDPYCRVLAGFQNWKGNDAYVEAILSNQKRRIFNLIRIENLPMDQPNIYGITPMLAACRVSNRYEAKRLMKLPINYERRDPAGRTALHVAAHYSASVPLIKVLLKNGEFDINSQDNDGNTPLHLAYFHAQNPNAYHAPPLQEEAESTTGSTNSNNSESVVEQIVMYSESLNPNTQNTDGYTVFHLACCLLDAFVIEQLLCNGVDLSLKDREGHTALDIIYTVGKNAGLPEEFSMFAACLAAFIKQGVAIDPIKRICVNGDTVLHLMCQESQYDAVAILLKVPNVDINVVNDEGRTPFEDAFEKDNGSIGALTSLFLDHSGMNFAVLLNYDLETILHVACRTRNLPAVLSLMKHHHAPVNAYNRYKRAALHIAYQEVDSLISGPVMLASDPVAKSQSAETSEPPREMSTTERSIVEALLRHSQTDPNIPNNDDDALIHMACRREDYKTLQLLLGLKRTNVNLPGRSSYTPLQIAFKAEDFRKIGQQSPVDAGNPGMSLVMLLLQNNRVYPDIVVDTTGNTLLHYACSKANVDAIRLLLNNPNTEVNRVNAFSKTALQAAFKQDNWQNRTLPRVGPLAKLMVECERVDASAPLNDQGETLLHIACRSEDIDTIMNLLQRKNVNVNAVNYAGHTPFQVAYDIDQKKYDSVLQKKHQHQPFPGRLSRCFFNNGRVNLDVPVDNKRNFILHILTKFDCAKLEIKDKNLKEKEIAELVEQILMVHCANPNVEDADGRMPLYYVFRNEGFLFSKHPQRSILNLFLRDRRLNPNIIVGSHGGTMLHLACLKQDVLAVKVLLSHPNIDILVQDGQKAIPFELALEMKQPGGSSLEVKKEVDRSLHLSGPGGSSFEWEKPDVPKLVTDNYCNSYESELIIALIYKFANERLNEKGKKLLTEALSNDILAKGEMLKKKKRF